MYLLGDEECLDEPAEMSRATEACTHTARDVPTQRRRSRNHGQPSRKLVSGSETIRRTEWGSGVRLATEGSSSPPDLGVFDAPLLP